VKFESGFSGSTGKEGKYEISMASREPLRKRQSWPMARLGEALHSFFGYFRGCVEFEN
jgi:hypothetical protein